MYFLVLGIFSPAHSTTYAHIEALTEVKYLGKRAGISFLNCSVSEAFVL